MDRLAAAWLVVYAAAFSFAYVWLSAGIGALILFAAVQMTMITGGIRAGERFSLASWTGLALSLGGLLYLVSPGLTAPPLRGAALMAIAGCAWGLYSLRSRSARDSLTRTAGNFLGATAPALVISLLAFRLAHASEAGLLLAIISGSVTSGVGYVIWYSALRHLTSTAAASVQLAVPVLAGLGGVVILGEQFTFRLLIASAVILAGIALVLRSRAARTTQARANERDEHSNSRDESRSA